MTSDKQTTEKAFPRVGPKDFTMGVLWVLVISGVGIVGVNLLYHVRAPAWEAGVLYSIWTLALVAMGVLTPFYVMTHMRKKSEHRGGR
ncbi:hypothetical protein ACMAUO_20460 [Gluconacetobacter sp. Hr-1-5]|uniref:hypothetical protein n=1 Tax=Gluconacetobacter sp. Hr-1-5 TaxID=3395370 RepID=UPI003B521882